MVGLRHLQQLHISVGGAAANARHRWGSIVEQAVSGVADPEERRRRRPMVALGLVTAALLAVAWVASACLLVSQQLQLSGDAKLLPSRELELAVEQLLRLDSGSGGNTSMGTTSSTSSSGGGGGGLRTGGGAIRPHQAKCYCAVVTLPFAEHNRWQQHGGAAQERAICEARYSAEGAHHFAKAFTTLQERECGTASCPPLSREQAAHPCTFHVLLHALPKSLYNPRTQASTPIRGRSNVPRFCSVNAEHRRKYLEFVRQRVPSGRAFDLPNNNVEGELWARREEWQDQLDGLVAMKNACVRITSRGSERSGRTLEIYNKNACLEKDFLKGFMQCPVKGPPKASDSGAEESEVVTNTKAIAVNAYGRKWSSQGFQHYIIDHLGPILRAKYHLYREPGVQYLTDIGDRGHEILQNTHMGTGDILRYKEGTLYCAKTVYINTELPPDQTRTAPQIRLPEDFLIASKAFIRPQMRSPKDLIVIASRTIPKNATSLSAQRKLRNIANEPAVIKEINRYLEEKKLSKNLKVHVYSGLNTSIKETINIFGRARIILGMHGANMANIVFGMPSKSTSVIEFVGTRMQKKYEEYLSYYWDGWATPLDYVLIPQKCGDKQCSDDRKLVVIDDLRVALDAVLSRDANATRGMCVGYGD